MFQGKRLKILGNSRWVSLKQGAREWRKACSEVRLQTGGMPFAPGQHLITERLFMRFSCCKFFRDFFARRVLNPVR